MPTAQAQIAAAIQAVPKSEMRSLVHRHRVAILLNRSSFQFPRFSFPCFGGSIGGVSRTTSAQRRHINSSMKTGCLKANSTQVPDNPVPAALFEPHPRVAGGRDRAAIVGAAAFASKE